MKNKKKGNMYEWIDKTVNPLAGECSHKCRYCYVNGSKKRYESHRIKYSGPPRISENGLKQINGKDKIIFIVTMNGLFAEDVSFDVINAIINKCKSKPYNKYLLQTKNTKRFLELAFILKEFWTGNYWKGEKMERHNIFILCTTFETNRYYPDIMCNSPRPLDRILEFKRLGLTLFDKHITIEPIIDFDLDVMVKEIKDVLPKQVNIGADSGNNNLPEPPKEKILELITELEKFTKVKQKSNLKRLLK